MSAVFNHNISFLNSLEFDGTVFSLIANLILEFRVFDFSISIAVKIDLGTFENEVAHLRVINSPRIIS